MTVDAVPIIHGYYRYTDIQFEWGKVLDDQEDFQRLKAFLSMHAMANPEHPFWEGKDKGAVMYRGQHGTDRQDTTDTHTLNRRTSAWTRKALVLFETSRICTILGACDGPHQDSAAITVEREPDPEKNPEACYDCILQDPRRDQERYQGSCHEPLTI